jgi:hypothetical protein
VRLACRLAPACPDPPVFIVVPAHVLARLAWRAVGLPLNKLAGEIEHHVPAETPLHAQRAEHNDDPIIGGVAGLLALGGGAHVGTDVAMRRGQIVVAAAGLRLALIFSFGDLKQAFA